MPCGEAFFEYSTMTYRAHLMSGQRLRATRIAKAAHLAFAPAGRLAAVPGTVVHACGRFDENVLHMSALGNVLPQQQALGGIVETRVLLGQQQSHPSFFFMKSLRSSQPTAAPPRPPPHSPSASRFPAAPSPRSKTSAASRETARGDRLNTPLRCSR